MTAVMLGAAGSMGGEQIILSTTTVGNSVVGSPPTGAVSHRLNSNGRSEKAESDTFQTEPGIYTDLEAWVLPDPPGGSWSVRVTVQSGDTPNGDALNTWLALSTSRRWWFGDSGDANDKSATLRYEFSPNGGTSIVATVDKGLSLSLIQI